MGWFDHIPGWLFGVCGGWVIGQGARAATSFADWMRATAKIQEIKAKRSETGE